MIEITEIINHTVSYKNNRKHIKIPDAVRQQSMKQPIFLEKEKTIKELQIFFVLNFGFF